LSKNAPAPDFTGLVDEILELPQSDVQKAGELWKKLDGQLEALETAVRTDKPCNNRLLAVTTRLRSSASKFMRSLACCKGGGPLRNDWVRFAERDLAELKDELLALKEFLVEEAEFIEFALARARLLFSGKCDPERLFRELHEAGAVSERTWTLLMSYPGSWKKAVERSQVADELQQISRLLFDLQEVRIGSHGTPQH